MLTLRKSKDRGHHQEKWLDSRHTFSFDTYYDPDHMGFRDLRVINEDRVSPDHGFGMHPHRDMEIFTLVLSGALEHRDNLGNREVIGPWQIQKITAGTGIRHSETNPSTTEEVHLLQIWIMPEEKGLEPGYVLKDFSSAPENRLTPILTPDGRDGSVQLRQDAAVYLGRFSAGGSAEFRLEEGRHAWVQVIRGELAANGQRMEEADGAAISEEEMLKLTTEKGTDLLLFDLN